MKDQQGPSSVSPSPKHDSVYPCVETGIWTPIPKSRPKGDLRITLKSIDSEQNKQVKSTNRLTFHAVGCSGRYEQCPDGPQPGTVVANALAKQATDAAVYNGYSSADPASFLFHLGDVVYKAESVNNSVAAVDPDQSEMYDIEFYRQYASYEPEILSIPGNHDSKWSKHSERSAIDHYLINFCDSDHRKSPDNTSNQTRETMIQPYPYWTLETPIAYIVGLDTNDVNGGLLDDPQENDEPQYTWLLETLRKIKAAEDGKRLVVAVHYPPYSGGANFIQRGDPNLGPTPRRNPGAGLLQPLAVTLQHAYQQAGFYPDLVISAHAHLYQRITYTYTGGHQIPYLICGASGHWPIENIAEGCDKSPGPKPTPPSPVVLPRGVVLPPGDLAVVASFNDTDFGFLRITIDLANTVIAGEFFAVDVKDDSSPKLFDSFRLDLQSHKLRTQIAPVNAK
jgi:Calcineurin-like phosphoesterase